MGNAFQTWIQGLRPSWMSTRAKAILGGFAQVLGDLAISWAEQANLEHLPLAAQDTNSIALIASERQIIPGPTETTASLQSRLVRAVPQWQAAGTPIGLLVAFYYTGFPSAVIVQQNGLAWQITGTPNVDDLPGRTALPLWITRTVLGARPSDGHAWWTFDHNDAFCSRFAILFPDPSQDPHLGVDANLARAQLILQKWRPAKATCVSMYVIGTGKFVGWPVRIVGSGGTVGPSTVTPYAGA